ncbi:vancomycin resistance protein YoaR [Bacillus fengqiuensis]|nr:vancomycin resistance protein YoaR [Bacillus fengqiuensis]
MKNGFIAAALGILLAGCASEKANATPIEVEEINEHVVKTEGLEVKEIKPDYFVYKLIDSRTGELLTEYQPVHYSEKEVYENDIEELAEKMAKEIDQPMKNAKVDGKGHLIPGTKRIVLSEKELVENLKNLQIDNELTVTVPIYETMPNITKESTKGITEQVIATYTTNFRTTDTGRNRNIELSAAAINNVVLGPGDYFSYNEVVGPRTSEAGYQPAPEILNKELVMGIGGGICQTSSTLFNAVDQAGVKVTAITHHSKSVGYVPEGRDATVSWGGPDFKFINDKDYPIMLKAKMDKEKGTLTVEVRAAKKAI